MSVYRTLLAAVAAVVLASPVFADNAMDTSSNTEGTQATQTTSGTDAQQVSSNQTTESKVNVNKATAKELMAIKGINSARARAIIAYRNKNGDFKSTEELSSVKGFKKLKPDTLKDIEGQLTVE